MSSKSKLTCSDGMEKACKQLNRYVKSMSTSLQREDQQPGGTTLPMVESFQTEKTVWLKVLIKYINRGFGLSMHVKTREHDFL